MDDSSDNSSVFSIKQDMHFDMDVPINGGSVSSGSVSGSGVSGTTSSPSAATTSRQSTVYKNDNGDMIDTSESKHLVKLRCLLVTVLFWCTVGIAIFVWAYFSEAEEDTFEDQYYEDTVKVFEAFGRSFDLSIGTIDSFVVGMVSLARFTNQNWPYVSIPDYAVRVAKTRKLSKAVLVTQYHYVTGDQRLEWQNYTMEHNGWVQNSIEQQENDETFNGSLVTDYSIRSDIHANQDKYDSPGPYLPKWQHSPVVPIYAPYNWDGFKYTMLASVWNTLHQERRVVLGHVSNIPTPMDPELSVEGNNHFISDFVGQDKDHTEPFGDLFYPIVTTSSDEITLEEDDAQNGDVAGVVAVTFYWRDLLKNILPSKSDGMQVVVENTCNQTFTYELYGPDPVYLGSGDLHEAAFDNYKQSFSFTDIGTSEEYTGLPLSSYGCVYTVHTYPSTVMQESYQTRDPVAYSWTVAGIFLFTAMVFIMYDCLVERRQKKVMTSAVKSNAIVSSLFPKNVRDRLYKEQMSAESQKGANATKTRLKSFMTGSTDEDNQQAQNADAPIADLFLNCTVLFADISGFTSWSSERSPSQVFVLLETIYGAFDKIADRRSVFKVETIGDCYVAVTGLPNPKKDHASQMVKFARDCRDQMKRLTEQLEITLGPETGDLSMRFGLHSGPVTAGVLRGQKSRFQLFGDTVNTAARMESTGTRNQIQISDETARLLIEAGKSDWLTQREETVQAKGKGELKTWWAFYKRNKKIPNCSSTVASSDCSLDLKSLEMSIESGEDFMDEKTRRLIDWNVDLLGALIRKIVARRKSNSKGIMKKGSRLTKGSSGQQEAKPDHQMVLDEVVEVLELPAFDAKVAQYKEDPHSIHLGLDVMMELRMYIVTISTKYQHNPFHNFQHASHVCMSVAKLLSRITAPDLDSTNHISDENVLSRRTHDHTYGITNDPLTQFACLFSALVHDVEHQGVANAVLVQEGDPTAKKYKGKSVAEQNSVDVAWDLFMEPQFAKLRNAICSTNDELRRFRQLIVNMVLATDVWDPDLKDLRNKRWDKAFSYNPDDDDEGNDQDQINRKATIVIEHLIQASDVCHCMQHWHVYRKWNECLFEELYLGYQSGRCSSDPSTFWYEGELKFFDNYIIPLTKKLSDCGVFGVSSDELLSYALKNRAEWSQRGKDVVAEMAKKFIVSSENNPPDLIVQEEQGC